MNALKRLRRYFTFWLFLICILILILNLIGSDDKNILLVGLNPILSLLVYTEPFRSISWNHLPNSFMYLAHIIYYITLGVLIDFNIYLFKDSYSQIQSFKDK